MSDESLFYKGFGISVSSKTDYDVPKRQKNTTGGLPPICGSPSSCSDLPDKLVYRRYAFIQVDVFSLTI